MSIFFTKKSCNRGEEPPRKKVIKFVAMFWVLLTITKSVFLKIQKTQQKRKKLCKDIWSSFSLTQIIDMHSIRTDIDRNHLPINHL